MKNHQDKWIYTYEREPDLYDAQSTEYIYVNWVNLEHDVPFFGIDIEHWELDFKDYLEQTGRIVFRWTQVPSEEIILPNEVVDRDTLFEYLKFVNKSPLSNNY